MKHSFVLLLLIVAGGAKAQFNNGARYISAGVLTSFDDFKYPNAAVGSYTHDVSLSFGRFADSKRALGWDVKNWIYIDKTHLDSVGPTNFSRFTIGINRFWEFYKPLTEKFLFYVRPSVGLSYSSDRRREFNTNFSYFESSYQGLSVNTNLKFGVCLILDKRWTVYTDVGVISPLDITVGIQKTRGDYEDASYGANIRTKRTYSNVGIDPSLGAVGLGLGIRYAW